MIIVYFLLLLRGAHVQGLDAACDPGFQLRDNENTCEPCTRGRYHEQKSHMDTGPCKACPAGYQDTYTGDPQFGTCEMCPSGYYQEHEGHAWCKKCEKDYNTATTCYDNECDAGEYLSGDTCKMCSPGKYSTGGATSCTECPPGKFGFAGLSGAPHCQDCPAGYTTDFVTGTVSVLPYVHNGDNSFQWVSACSQCDEGKHSAKGSAGCCEPGKHYVNDYNSCDYCPVGKYSEKGGKCTNCVAGKYIGTVGAIFDWSCKDCEAGKYSDITGAKSASDCTNCTAGKYSTSGASACLFTSDSCPRGTFANSTASCTDCSPGKYSNITGATNCTNCTAGKYSEVRRLTSADACAECEAGKYSNIIGATSVSNCTNCEAGKYSGQRAATSASTCTDCEAGKYSGQPAATSVSVCKECEAGKYSNSAAPVCTDCEAGKYSGQLAATSVSDCTDCEAGKYSGQPAATSASVCTDCEGGFYSISGASACLFSMFTCPRGTFANSTASCTDCPAGKYSSETGAILESVCTDCEAGTYSISGASDCTNCTAGKYFNSAASACTDCEVGKYSDQQAATSCKSCSKGKYQDQKQTTSCIGCEAGKYSNITGATSCKFCDTGRYQDQRNATSCKTCHQGKYYNSIGATQCKDCTRGTYQNEEGMTDCKQCEIGKMNNQDSQTTCTDCTSGTYQNEKGMTACKSCDRGLFQDQTGKQSCKQCVKGSYQNEEGMTECISCGVGKYSEFMGRFYSWTCQDCLGGEYQDQIGMPSCKVCEAGQYSNKRGAETCTLCPKGTYLEGTRARYESECLWCEEGKYSMEEGATSSSQCKDCPEGYYSETDRCTECPEGQYQDQQGKGSCKRCAGDYTGGTGSTTPTICTGCEAGKYYHEGLPLKGCQDCPSGKYSNTGHIETGTDFTIEPCLTCTNNTIYEEYTYKNGASVVLPRTVDRCKKCPYSTYYQGGHCLSCQGLDVKDPRCECPKGSIFNGKYCSNNIECQAGHYLNCTDTAVTTQYKFPNGTKATQADYDNNLAYAVYTGVEEECTCAECPLAYKSSWSSTKVQTWSEGGYQRTCHAPKNCQYSYERNKCTEDGCECDVCDGDLNSIFGGKYSVNCHNKCNGSIGLQGNQLQVKATCGCDEGYYVKSNGCHKCPDGQWSAGGRVTECKSCAKNEKRNGNVCESCGNGYYSEGGDVEECKKLCGVGETSNGTNCVSCASIKSCTMVPGDSTGGSNVKVGEANSEQECFNLVRSTEPDANGATMQIGGGECWAEFDVSGRVDLAGWETCQFIQQQTSQGKECYVADDHRQNTCGDGEITDADGDCHECLKGKTVSGNVCSDSCNNDEKLVNGTCVNCEQGKWSDGTMTECHAKCLHGMSDTGSGCQTCLTGTSVGRNCFAAHYKLQISVRPMDCGENEYINNSVCTACEDGKTSTGGNVYQCFSDCNDNQFNDGNGNCQDCSEPDAIGGGHSTSCLLECKPGQKNLNGVCVDCGPGTWSSGGYVEKCDPLDCTNVNEQKVREYKQRSTTCSNNS